MDSSDAQQALGHFDAKAADWDGNALRVTIARTIARAMIAALPLSRVDTVLDYGAGTGLGTVELARAAGRVVAAEPSEKMFEALRAKLSGLAAGNAHPVRWSADAPYAHPLRPTVVVGAMVLHHVQDIDAAARAFADLLPSGGRIGFADLDLDGGAFHGPDMPTFHDGFCREALGAVFARAGFQDIAFRDVMPVEKPKADGTPGRFSIFLMTGRKP